MFVRVVTYFFIVFSSLSFLSVNAHAQGSQEPILATQKTSQEPILSAQEILTRFSQSSRTASYLGDFTFDDGRSSSAYRVTHGVVNGKERQKLKSLHGPSYGFLIEGVSVKSDSDKSNGEKCNTIGERLIQGMVSSPTSQYNLVLRGEERIANRNALNILFVPKDAHRYGVSLSIDSESYLLLRYLIYGESQKILERLQFISLQNDIRLDKTHFDKSLNEQPPSLTELECSEGENTVQSVFSLRPSWLPKGFVLSMSKKSGADGTMETYTDGLSAFSVFVRKAKPLTKKNEKRVEQGMYKKGALVAVFNLVPVNAQAMAVTVVGEIPQATAQKIALSMNSNDS